MLHGARSLRVGRSLTTSAASHQMLISEAIPAVAQILPCVDEARRLLQQRKAALGDQHAATVNAMTLLSDVLKFTRRDEDSLRESRELASMAEECWARGGRPCHDGRRGLCYVKPGKLEAANPKC